LVKKVGRIFLCLRSHMKYDAFCIQTLGFNMKPMFVVRASM
jgi:hypothetical protein